MSTTLDLFRRAAALGLELRSDGDKLQVSRACPPEFADELRQAKAELLQWLRNPPCPGWGAVPPADLVLNPFAPEPKPTERELVLGYVVRQAPSLASWMMRREAEYFDGPGRKWDCGVISYAAARDCACWQLHCNEQHLLELLAGFEECRRERT